MFWMSKVPDNNSAVYDVEDRRITNNVNTTIGLGLSGTTSYVKISIHLDKDCM